MGRSGYTEIEDSEDVGRAGLYLGRVANSIRGKRGQAALVNIVKALDAMEKKELVEGSFNTESGVCTLGALGLFLEINTDDLEVEEGVFSDDEVDCELAGSKFNITACMAAHIMWENDEMWTNSSPHGRWQGMRAWALGKLKSENKEIFNEIQK